MLLCVFTIPVFNPVFGLVNFQFQLQLTTSLPSGGVFVEYH